jgi:hypothetical protein
VLVPIVVDGEPLLVLLVFVLFVPPLEVPPLPVELVPPESSSSEPHAPNTSALTPRSPLASQVALLIDCLLGERSSQAGASELDLDRLSMSALSEQTMI